MGLLEAWGHQKSPRSVRFGTPSAWRVQGQEVGPMARAAGDRCDFTSNMHISTVPAFACQGPEALSRAACK